MPEARNPIVGFPDPFNNHGDRIVITFFYVLAIVLTLCRLGRRLRIHRFSWDDSWAAFALALLVAKMALDWTRVGHDVKPRTEDDVAQFKSDMKMFFTLQTSLVSAIVWYEALLRSSNLANASLESSSGPPESHSLSPLLALFHLEDSELPQFA
ncbi:hypothetical protein AAF712_004894 [Marasmius tenuissimus]|uniref:Uncharacterized protein n=1 Tax=Marasmius tenuissimus TaxID=585030 RepID=A0ABR3A287_9AGAR